MTSRSNTKYPVVVKIRKATGIARVFEHGDILGLITEKAHEKGHEKGQGPEKP